jgi:hypothetical protein
MEGDTDFRTVSREALVGVTYGPAQISGSAPHIRAAYNAATKGRILDAVAHSEAAVEAAKKSGDLGLAGWLGEAHASYVQTVDRVRAQAVLSAAASLNSAILRPIVPLDYQKLGTPSDQALNCSACLTQKYESGSALIVGVDAILSDITWDNDRTDEAEWAIAELGLHLGFTSQQPERDFKIGSDVMWGLGDRSYAVIEAKTGATGPMIWKRDINQLSGSVVWCHREYGTDAKVVPVLFHLQNIVEGSGTPPQGARVVTDAKLRHLKFVVRNFARALAVEDQYKISNQVDIQLRELKLSAVNLFAEFTVMCIREPRKII